MIWINWKKEKPKEKGYYLFATHSGGNSYSNYSSQEVGYFDPESPKYEISGRQSEINEMGEFFTIVAWMNLPEFPLEFLKGKND